MTNSLSPIRYPGGKSRAVKLLRPYIRSGSDLFSPFFGGGSVEFDAARRGAKVYGYDTYGPLVCFYQQLKVNREALIDATLALHPLKDDKFVALQESVHLMPDGPNKAAGLFALNYTTHMSLMQCNGPTRSHDRFDPNMIRNKLAFKMHDVTVEELDFRESFTRHPDTFAFIDPPYVMRNQRNERLYGVDGSHHRDFAHDDLFALLKDRKNWIMTHQDHPNIRERYKDFEIEEASWRYSMTKQVGRELIIKSRDHSTSSGNSYFGSGTKPSVAKLVGAGPPLKKWLELANTNPVAKAMRRAEFAIDSVVTGRSQIAILSGVPGIGKSHLLNGCAARMAEREIKTMRRQFSHPRDLDDAIFNARGRSLIVADEADAIMRSKPQIERLKLLADPTFKSPIEIGSGEKVRTLKMTCPIIIAFNASTDVVDPNIQIQLDALFSRKRPIIISGSKEELWEYSVIIALTTTLLRNIKSGGQVYGGSLKSFATALNIFTRNIWNLEEVSPRALQQIYKLVCENQIEAISDVELELELSGLMASGPSQHANIPPQEDWADLRRQFIAFKNAQKNGAKSTLFLPAPANNSSLAKAA